MFFIVVAVFMRWMDDGFGASYELIPIQKKEFEQSIAKKTILANGREKRWREVLVQQHQELQLNVKDENFEVFVGMKVAVENGQIKTVQHFNEFEGTVLSEFEPKDWDKEKGLVLLKIKSQRFQRVESCLPMRMKFFLILGQIYGVTDRRIGHANWWASFVEVFILLIACGYKYHMIAVAGDIVVAKHNYLKNDVGNVMQITKKVVNAHAIFLHETKVDAVAIKLCVMKQRF